MRKTLHMLLTLALLILAAYVLHWQETETPYEDASAAAALKAAPVALAKQADCCLRHALQATQGDTAGDLLAMEPGRVLRKDELLHHADSSLHPIAATYLKMPLTN
ncbi:hypothetical protein [Pontibacter actiniarum]|nr:hypothetical protein [Pontibacter actiniarum]